MLPDFQTIEAYRRSTRLESSRLPAILKAQGATDPWVTSPTVLGLPLLSRLDHIRRFRRSAKPRLQSMVVANQVYQHVTSHGFVIAGTLNCVRFRQKQQEFSSQPPTLLNQPREFFAAHELIGSLRILAIPDEPAEEAIANIRNALTGAIHKYLAAAEIPWCDAFPEPRGIIRHLVVNLNEAPAA